jgi:chromate transporter
MISKTFEVFWRFLTLGCISFGGPAAHIGYFQTAFVQKLKWLDADAYARIISLSQFLPGPGSSQVGFAIGLRHAGVLGGFAAFLGFTLPSFLILYFLASSNLEQHSSKVFNGVVHGLKLLAVVVVAQATLSMFNSFCKEKLSLCIAVLTTVILLCFPSLYNQIFVLLIAAILGVFFGKPNQIKSISPKKSKLFPLILFFMMLFALPFLAKLSIGLNLFSDFYQAGSLVFGGGHVVLPLLQEILGNSVSTDRFLLGYATAQAIPGPMFTLATFLGAEIMQDNKMLGALLATAGVFLPGFLLVLGLHNTWEGLAAKPKIAGAIWGVNASVVGLLLSALYNPVFINAVFKPVDMAIVIIGFCLLKTFKIPIVFLVLVFAATGPFISN